MKNGSVSGPSGTIVLPIRPNPQVLDKHTTISIMTISNVLYTPTGTRSELSWPVLKRQGFTMKRIHSYSRVVKNSPFGKPEPVLKGMLDYFVRRKVYAVQHPRSGANLLYASQLEPDLFELCILPTTFNAGQWEKWVMGSVLQEVVNLRGTYIMTDPQEDDRFRRNYKAIVLYPKLELVGPYNRHPEADVDLLTRGGEVATVLEG
ncbi:hypothetical protein LTR84_008761 [Exophiala bonariae]|uniref:Uncharacterized protein n=1 Tax=Exophiala bonariae TaxID=1690606 RepID=A0AAV9MX04_9EURO|nr:hypothetical protein LTR84_008761 [Exophiala bonariae]